MKSFVRSHCLLFGFLLCPILSYTMQKAPSGFVAFCSLLPKICKLVAENDAEFAIALNKGTRVVFLDKETQLHFFGELFDDEILAPVISHTSTLRTSMPATVDTLRMRDFKIKTLADYPAQTVHACNLWIHIDDIPVRLK